MDEPIKLDPDTVKYINLYSLKSMKILQKDKWISNINNNKKKYSLNNQDGHIN